VKKNALQPQGRPCWVIPPEQHGACVAPREEVLERDPLPSHPPIPLVCRDEQPVQRLKETRPPLPAAPGKPEQVDDESERQGTAHLCMFTAPLHGPRPVRVTEPRTAVDWAKESRDLLAVRDPEAARVRLVGENRKTHGIGSLSEALPPEKARALLQRLERPHTPTHGSWLTLADRAWSALTGQCLERRMPDLETWRKATSAWEQRRHACHQGVDGQCTTQNARRKLKRLYPQIQA